MDAFELVFAEGFEAEVVAAEDVDDGAADPEFVGAGEGADAGADVDDDAGQVVVVGFYFTDVGAGADVEVEGVAVVDEALGAFDGVAGRGERDEVAVAFGVDESAAVEAGDGFDEVLVAV